VKVIVRFGLGSIFLYAAYDKLLHPNQFAEIIIDYEMLPLWIINIVALWLSALEAIVGVCVILGVWVRANALLMSGLMVIFITGIVVALARGAEGLHCGCFSTSPDGEPRTWISLWQEILIFAGCVLLRVIHCHTAEAVQEPRKSENL
jgi:uncharacterized membrane protein YphA (DoxX/SURF4 family)